jgi:FkbM family methyltransferase
MLARAYRHLRDSRWLAEDPIETPMGFKFVRDDWGMHRGEFEREETETIKRILSKVDVFINVGANIGYYCCIALAHGKRVVAFEPVEMNVRFLMKNVMANKWERNIEIFPVALSDRPGVLTIYGGGTGASLVKGWADTPEHQREYVPASTLDTILGGRFEGKRCLILVDVEGAEASVLEGANRSLGANPKPVWMVEISVTEHQPKGTHLNPHLARTFDSFFSRGYEAWTAGRSSRQVLPEEVATIAQSGRDTLRTHNFLFVAPGERIETLVA